MTMDELVNMIVGRPLEDKYPKHTRTIGDIVLEAKNVHPGHQGQRRPFLRPQGRDPGHLRPGGRRPHRTDALHLRRRPPRKHGAVDGRQTHQGALGHPGHQPRHRLRHRGPQARWSGPWAWTCSTTPTWRICASFSHFGFLDDKAGAENAPEICGAAAHQDPQHPPALRQPVRRQPAKGRSGQVAVQRRQGADRGRTHPRHRRGRQVRGLRAVQPPERPGRGPSS